MTGNGTDTGAALLLGYIPANTRTTETHFQSNSNWYLTISGDKKLMVFGNYSNGTVYAMNEDVICDWND